MPTRADIDDFLAQHRLAVVGVSRDEKAFANAVYRELRAKGYELVPVNAATEPGAVLEGDPAFSSVEEVDPPVDGAIVLVSADHAAAVVEACDRAGITRVWLHKGAGPSSVSDEAVGYCHEHGLRVVDGACPMMFFEPVRGVHRFHRGFRALTGRAPT